ncbi:hypothetical protein AFE02nite_08480 [Actinotalea fermentans]|uniref:YCII-related domain-containing protein n=1 Tax=Actinotalea fermentans TaxID=43671 RepID=A0A511YV82_9CELL|nr:hypothetical protein AFE02nite_08480 [Actinotalea fermentans]
MICGCRTVGRVIAIELALSPTPERLAARPAHRAIVAELHARGVVHAAGPFADDSGALVLVDGDLATAEEVLAGDPYYRSTHGVRVVSVREWAPVVGP